MPTLYVLQGPDKGRTYQPHETVALIGRSADGVPLTDQGASRRHARLREHRGQWYLEDLRSANGTYLNGVAIHKLERVKHGDQIRVGSTLMVFTSEEETQAPPTSKVPRDLVDLDVASNQLDASIVSSMPSNEDSVIIAAPEQADASQRLAVMYEMATIVSEATSTDQLLERVTDLIFDQVQVDRAFILLIGRDGGKLQPRVVRSRLIEDQDNGRPKKIAASRKIIEHAMKHSEAVLCTNAMTDQRFSKRQDDSIHNYGLRSVICAPIIARETVIGVIHLDCSMSAHTFAEAELHLIAAVGYMTGLAVQNARLVSTRLQGERLAAVGETVAYLSHHIKNILQGMRGGADVVTMGLDGKDLGTIAKGWDIVHRNLDRIYCLSLNMLAFSKHRKPRRELVHVSKPLGDAVELATRMADPRGVMLFYEPDPSLPPITLDAEGFHQAVLNILSNAVEAVPDETGRVDVATHFDEAHNRMLITVTDNGPGIPEEELSVIFQPFHSSKGHAGTGLGLAVARKAIQEHGGQITVTSEVGEGTIFEISLPAGEGHVADSSETSGPAE